ncbi:T9SS type A sorting domain-containing protein [Polaribacter batillariae]|uniref:T9SS type A sorting domain-containing protein n=1 Tax=Polaribacter batillariae TaxID=2808900 RepID=A0ABX7ST99_9FLAO|nr:T9SS type A sorting domain-containing protein [Polaribacter batillariae]QTD36771.1 T9SS type A sorting domain-containing protein [Polaribacter batillariae]
MKKIMNLMFCIIITNVAWSQDFHVASGGEITTLPGGVLYAGSNVSVVGNLTVESDATKSGSFIVQGNATGNITYERHISDTNWHLISAPVATYSVSNFIADASNNVAQSGASSNYGVSYYKNTNTPTKRWTYHNTAPTKENQETLANFESGVGYSMKKTTAGNYTFTGALADEDVTVSIPKISSGTNFWACVGNPYPSFLPANNNANAVANVLSENIDKLDPSFAFLYIWNGTTYAPLRHSDPALQLAPGQAFLVAAKSANETFTFPKALQNHQNGTATFYKTSNATPTISLYVSNGSASKSTTIEFLEEATTGLDVGYDAGAYQDGTPTFSLDTHLVSDSKGIDFTIQSLPTSSINSNIAIPLSVRAAANQELSFSVSVNNLPKGVDVYLEDKKNNTFAKLTETSHKINVTKSLNGIGRFFLYTSSKVLNTENAPLANAINIYKTQNNVLRIVGLNTQNNSTLKMYSVTGKKILTNQFVAGQVKDIQLPTNLATGIYIVNIVSEKGEYTKKLIIE